MGALFKDQAGNILTMDPSDPRGYRAANKSEIDAFMLEGMENAQGGTWWDRFKVKNFAAGLEQAKEYYKRKGYEIRDLPASYGANFNFAVRKPGEPWRPIDPRASANPLEWLRDFMDLGADLASGSAYAAGVGTGAVAGSFAGGLPGMVGGAMAGGGLTQAATETGREAIGSALGIPNNMSASNIAQAGATGAVTAPLAGATNIAGHYIGQGIGKALAPLGRGLSGLQRELSASIIGIPKRGSLDPDEILDARAKDPRKVLETFEQAAKPVVDFFLKLRGKGPEKGMVYPEKIAALQDEARAEASGVTLNFRPIIDRINENSLPDASPDIAIKGIEEKGYHKQAKALAESLNARLKVLLGDNYDWSKLPPSAAVQVKRELQRIARREGGYAGRPIEDHFKDLVVSSGAESRMAILNAMADAGFDQYGQNMLGVEYKEHLRRQFEAVLGLTRGEVARDPTLLKPYNVQKKIESYVKRVYGEAAGSERNFIADLEQAFGVDLSKAIKSANVGAAIGHEGQVSLRPRFTATGRLMNMGTMIGGAGLAMKGSPIMGALLTGGGIAAASPALQLGLTRVVQKIPSAAVKAGSFVPMIEGAASAAAPSVVRMRPAATSVVTSDDERLKRRGPTVIE